MNSENLPAVIPAPDCETLLQVAEESFKQMINPAQGIQLPLWKRFNELFGGLRPKELTIICAPTGSGKTQFGANLSAQLLMAGVPQFVASVETGRHDYVRRIASALARRNYNNRVPVPELEVHGLVKKFEALWRQNNIIFSKAEDRIPVKQMVDEMKWAQDVHGIRVAFLDNLNFFLRPVSSNMERAEFDDAIHEFVMMAKRLEMHTVLVLHPRKTDGGRVESEFDVKGSATAVQEAPNVFLFNRPKESDVTEGNCKPWDRELKFAKIRERGENTGMRLFFSYEHGAYAEKGVQDHSGKWEQPVSPTVIRRPYND